VWPVPDSPSFLCCVFWFSTPVKLRYYVLVVFSVTTLSQLYQVYTTDWIYHIRLPTILVVQVKQSVRCVFLCVCAWTILFDVNDLRPRCLACWVSLTQSRSSSKVKVHGHRRKVLLKYGDLERGFLCRFYPFSNWHSDSSVCRGAVSLLLLLMTRTNA